ncbi:hypothetical protein C8Q75DRAFT_119220 [Abortiporus biennis]|nr:hypothetical protein C8Q75DRAFT_119220 [Abortiporus biennis]
MFHTKNPPIQTFRPPASQVQLSSGPSFSSQNKEDTTKGGSSVEQSSSNNKVSLRGPTCEPYGRTIKESMGMQTAAHSTPTNVVNLSSVDADSPSHDAKSPRVEDITMTTAGTATIEKAVDTSENLSDPPKAENVASEIVSSSATVIPVTTQPPSPQNMTRCPYCLKQTGTSKSLKKHIKKHQRIWACSACSQRPYKTPMTLEKHILREHQDLSPDSIIEKIKNTEAYKTLYLGVIPKSSTMTVEPVPSVSDVIVSPSTALENDASIAEDTSEGGELTECNEPTENESTVESELVAATMPEDTPWYPCTICGGT